MVKEEFTFKSSDGINDIHAVAWLPDKDKISSPKAVIQISHGMIEYIERYEVMAEFFTDRGFVVTGNDHLGHGRSVKNEDEWGYFAKKNGSECVVDDLHMLTTITKEEYPDIPYFLIGHSMGSFMARRYLMTYGSELDGAVILGTGNQPRVLVAATLASSKLVAALRGDHYRSKFITKLIFGAYNIRIKNPKTANDWICADENVVAKYNADPACTFLFTVNGIQVLMQTLMFIESKKNINRIPKKLPVMLASGMEDPVGNYGKAVRKVYNILSKAGMEDLTIALFEGCRHELHNEAVKENLYEEIYQWILEHTSSLERGLR